MRKLVLACSFVVCVAAPAHGATKSKFFHSPSGNIECEIDTPANTTPLAYCETLSPPRSAVLRFNGKVTTCHGVKCLSDGPENAFTLRYGHSTTLGAVRCSSLRSGMRCVVRATGHGFKLSRAGVSRF